MVFSRFSVIYRFSGAFHYFGHEMRLNSYDYFSQIEIRNNTIDDVSRILLSVINAVDLHSRTRDRFALFVAVTAAQ